MTLRENLMSELVKLRTSRERPFPLQAKTKPNPKTQRSQKDKLLEEAQKLLDGIEEEN